MSFALLGGIDFGLGLGLGICLQKVKTLKFFNYSGILGWWQGILFAAPKKKVTHSRKRMRMATQYLRPMLNIEGCKICGSVKLMNTLCWTCYKRFRADKKMAE